MREDVVELLERVSNGENYADLMFEPRHRPEELSAAAERFINIYTESVSELQEPILDDMSLSKTINGILAPDTSGNIDSEAAKAEITRVVNVYLQEMGGDTERGYILIYIIGGAAVLLIALFAVIKAIRHKKAATRK
jgi:hypothetical protein